MMNNKICPAKKFWKEYKETDYFERREKLLKLGLIKEMCSKNFAKSLLSCDDKIREFLIISTFQAYFDDIFEHECDLDDPE